MFVAINKTYEMKTKIFTLAILTITTFAFAQNVNIPDQNFKKALLSHIHVIDTNNDGEIQVSEAEAFTGTIYVSKSNISNLIGNRDVCEYTRIIL